MDWTGRQIPIDISGTTFPEVDNGGKAENFWYVKNEFIRHSERLMNEGKLFARISIERVGQRWVDTTKQITLRDIALFMWSLRLFYMKTEPMSFVSICNYMEREVKNIHVNKFFSHMRSTWEKKLSDDVSLYDCSYSGPIKTNKNLIDTILYSGNFHSQEKFKLQYDELLEYMDESLIYKSAYNVLYSGYHMNQISRALSQLSETNLVIMLPAHLQHEWDDDCPYQVIHE